MERKPSAVAIRIRTTVARGQIIALARSRGRGGRHVFVSDESAWLRGQRHTRYGKGTNSSVQYVPQQSFYCLADFEADEPGRCRLPTS